MVDANTGKCVVSRARLPRPDEPESVVGAVVVSPDGVIVGQASTSAGRRNAEAHTLARRATPGPRSYCTLEPCCLRADGSVVTRIVEAALRGRGAVEDPNPVVRRGFATS